MTRKTTFFEGWSWLKINYFGLTLFMALNFYTSLANLKVRKFSGLLPRFLEVTEEKLLGGIFARPPSWIVLKDLNGSKDFSEYSYSVQDVYKKIEKYCPNKKRKILIFFDDLVADILCNKKLNPVVTELFIRSRKLNIFFFLLNSFILLVQKVLNYKLLNSTHYFIKKIPTK